MVRRTFEQAAPEISRVCGTTGMSTSDPRVKSYVNMATEELMNEHDFASVFDRLRFSITAPYITLPSSYDRIAMMNLECVPMRLQSPWFEFVGSGLELLADVDQTFLDRLNFLSGVLDKSEVCQFQPVPSTGTYLLRVYGQSGHDERDDDLQRPVINIRGYDADGKWIRTLNANSEWIEGIDVEINGDTSPYYISTTQSIREITEIIKPVTTGYVYVYACPEAGGDNVFLAAYAPKDTNPFYRRYYVKALTELAEGSYSILARVRRRYVPVTDDKDQLILSNIPALKAMVMALNYLESNDPDSYLKYKATAVDILKKEMRSYVGLQTGMKPVITVAESAARGRGNYIL